MARPLRVEVPGLWHHVMNRGLARDQVFIDAGDRSAFLEILTEARERWGLRTHAACLMDNHFHLLVEDSAGQLGRAMRHIGGVYTQRFNRAHGRDGPLFRGRYRSRLVQQERYLAELVRYIHMNPVHAGLVARAGDYQWSSHGHYLRGSTPDWLVTTEVMRRFGDSARALDEFVHARLPAAEREALQWSNQPMILGDEEFVSSWRERLQDEHGGPHEPSAHARRWLALTCEEVMDAVCDHYGVTRQEVGTGRRGRANASRHAALLLCVDHTPRTAREVGAALGVQPQSVPSLANRYRRRHQEDTDFAGDLERILQALKANAR